MAIPNGTLFSENQNIIFHTITFRPAATRWGKPSLIQFTAWHGVTNRMLTVSVDAK